MSCVISSEPAAFINKMINLEGTKISERVPESIHLQSDFKSEADGITSLLEVQYVHQNDVKGFQQPTIIVEMQIKIQI